MKSHLFWTRFQASFFLPIPLLLAAARGPLCAAGHGRHDSVRSAALGGAGIAVPAGAADLFANPAALAALDSPEAAMMYDRPHAGLPGVNVNAGSLAGALPLRRGALGLGVESFRVSGSKQETWGVLTYAAPLFRRVHAGMSLKNFHHRYLIGGDARAAVDPLFRGGSSRDAWTFDAGLTADLPGPFRAGLAARNINQPDVGLLTEDRLRAEIQAGAALDLGPAGWTLAADLLHARDRGKDRLQPCLGVEKTFYQDKLALRLGGNPRAFTGGFGLGLGSVTLDYSLSVTRRFHEDNAGTHQMQFKYRFSSRRS